MRGIVERCPGSPLHVPRTFSGKNQLNYNSSIDELTYFARIAQLCVMCLILLARLASRTGEYVSVTTGYVRAMTTRELMAVMYSIHRQPSGLCTMKAPILQRLADGQVVRIKAVLQSGPGLVQSRGRSRRKAWRSLAAWESRRLLACRSGLLKVLLRRRPFMQSQPNGTLLDGHVALYAYLRKSENEDRGQVLRLCYGQLENCECKVS